MKRTFRVLAMVAVAAASIPESTTHAQLTSADTAAFTRATQALLEAVTNGDSAVWARHTAAQWFMTDEEGRRHSRSEFLAALRPLPAGQHGVLRIAESHLVTSGEAVVMSYTVDEEHDYHGQHLRTRFAAMDTWIPADGGWRMLASQVTALPTPVQGRRLPRALLDEYAGTYTLTPEITLEIVVMDGELQLVRPTQDPVPLRALDERIFVRDGVRGFWLFERDGEDRVARLIYWRDNNPVVWQRHSIP